MKRWAAPASVPVLLGVWVVASALGGQAVVPGPVATFRVLGTMLADPGTWCDLLLTVSRGIAGLLLGGFLAVILGVPCGFRSGLMAFLSPPVVALQGCPPIIWITLLLVWAGSGTTVPVLVVAAATFPVLFINVAQGVASLDRRWFKMARLYGIPTRLTMSRILIPGVRRYALAGLSFALGITWKVAATAEFLGSGSGAGARIYWCYRLLDMPRLFAWTFLLILIGVGLEIGLIHPLRRSLEANPGGEGADGAA